MSYFIFAIKTSAQSKIITNILNSKLDNFEKINKIDLLFNDLTNQNHDSLNYYYTKFSIWLHKNSEFKKAIIYRKKAIFLTKKKRIIDTIFLQKNIYKLAKLYQKKTPKKAIKLFNEVIEIKGNNNIAINTYYQLGYTNLKINNYIKALEYFEITTSLFKNKNNYVNQNSCLQIMNICSNFGDLLHIKKGIKFGKYVDSLCNISVKKKKYKFLIKYGIANLYSRNILETYNIKKSKKYYLEALKIAKEKKDSLKISTIHNWLGNLYNTTNQKKSIAYLDKALLYCPKGDSINLRQIHYFYSLTYAVDKKYKKSIIYNHKSLKYLLSNDLMNLEQLDKQILIDSKDKYILLEMLPSLAETYLKHYEDKKNKKDLLKSIAYFKLSDYILNLIKQSSLAFKSRLFWRKISAGIYSKAIKACFLANDLEEAFYFMEKNKALLLMEDMANQNNRLLVDVSINLLNRESKLKIKLIQLENSLLNKPNNVSLNKTKIDLESKLYAFQDSIYKGKKRLNKEPTILTIKDVQKNLNNNEVFIEYHISKNNGFSIYNNNDNGYVIFITNKNNYLFEINNLTKFKTKVYTLINRIKKPFKTKEDKFKFKKLSFEIYNKLFPTPEIRNLIKNKKVTIAADSYLSFLPFETLITKNNGFFKQDYLIKNCIISYLYSYSFLKNSNPSKLKNTSLLGFAPINFTDKNLTTLINSKNELQNANNYFNGKIYVNQKATKIYFLKELPNHNIIHLATHANAQDSINPWIAFTVEKITLPELYLVKNKASLVVLSGCNTTLGKQEIGEGVMSLARGFFYGGAQSVVSSLWAVDDIATPYIMNAFYKNLYNKQTKSEALRNAKLSYLDNHSLSELSPHYWASFILLGKDDVLTHSIFNWYPYLFIFVGLITLFILYQIILKKLFD